MWNHFIFVCILQDKDIVYSALISFMPNWQVLVLPIVFYLYIMEVTITTHSDESHILICLSFFFNLQIHVH